MTISDNDIERAVCSFTPTAQVAPPKALLRAHRWAILRERWARRVPGLIRWYAIIITVLLVILLSGCGQATVEGHQLTLFALNQAQGAGPQWRTSEVLEAQRELIAANDPDVIMLSEVEEAHITLTTVGKGSAESVVPPGGRLFYGWEGTRVGFRVGNAVWIGPRVTFEREWVLSLPHAEGTWARNAIVIEIRWQGQLRRLVGTHLEAGGGGGALWRKAQAEAIGAAAPSIIFGDMNMEYAEMHPYVVGMVPVTAWHVIDAIWARDYDAWNGEIVDTHGASDHPFAARAVYSTIKGWW